MWADIRFATPAKGVRRIPDTIGRVKLDPNGKYIIALDQSTSCTGLVIYRLGSGITGVMELEREGVHRDTYVHELKKYIEALLTGNDIVAVLIEDVFKGGSQRTYEILNDLAKGIENMCKREVRISGRIERIYNPVWVAEFLKNINIPNKHSREIAKAMTKKVALEYYPWAEGFLEDAYDAIGICHSFVDACYNGDVTLRTPRLINNFISSKTTHKYDYEIIADSLPLTELGEVVLQNSSKIIPVRYNIELTPDDNARLATALYRDAVVSDVIPYSNWTKLFALNHCVTDLYGTKFRLIAMNTAKRINRDNFFEPLEWFEA